MPAHAPDIPERAARCGPFAWCTRVTSTRFSGDGHGAAGGAQEAGIGMQDQRCRDPRQRRREAPLVLEPAAEFPLFKPRCERDRYAAGQVDAVPGAEGQREIAGKGAQQTAKNFHRPHAMPVGPRIRALGDAFGREGSCRRVACHFAQRAVNVDESAAAQHALPGNAAEATCEVGKNFDFLRRLRGKTGVTAFGFQDHGRAAAQDQRRYTQSGARSHHGKRARSRCSARRHPGPQR